MRFSSFVSVSLTVIAAVLITACNGEAKRGEYHSIQGFTQGTTYHITYQHPTEFDLKEKDRFFTQGIRWFPLHL